MNCLPRKRNGAGRAAVDAMVARGGQQSVRLKLAVAAGGGSLLVILGAVGGGVGWGYSRDSSPPSTSLTLPPENYRRQKELQTSGLDGYAGGEQGQQHVNSALAGPVVQGEKGDQGRRGPPGMTVRGPPGPPGPPGMGWLDTSPATAGSCGCNQSLLRLYVQDLNPKLIPGPRGPPGPDGPVGHHCRVV